MDNIPHTQHTHSYRRVCIHQDKDYNMTHLQFLQVENHLLTSEMGDAQTLP